MKREDLLKLYKGGQRNFPGADLSEMDFTCEDLSGINLEGATLRKTQLCETKLANAIFLNADLRGIEICAEIRGSNINFSGANFEGTELYEGIIKKAIFDRANFKGACVAQFLMDECDFIDADFTNAWLSETELIAGRFKGAIFQKAYVDVNFWDADIAGADFSYAFFPCSPQHLIDTRSIDVSAANFANAIFLPPRKHRSPEGLDVSAIQGAICISTKSDIDKLNLAEYNSFAVEKLLEEYP